MAKATKNAKPGKPAGRTAKAPAAPRVVAGPTARAKAAADTETALYQVLEPFKFRGAVVKPTAPNGSSVFIEMTASEAEPFQDAGLLGTEASAVPDAKDSDGDDDGNTGGGDGAAAGSPQTPPAQ